MIMKQDNFLLIELEIADKSDLLIGAVDILPKCLLPFDLFKVFILFGDFNAKNASWCCKSNNTNDVEIKQWLDERGFEDLFPTRSKRSDAIIDFAIGHSTTRWIPVLFSSPFVTEKKHCCTS